MQRIFMVLGLSSLFFACDKGGDDDPINYPLIYHFSMVENSESNYYLYKSPGYEEIDPDGTFLHFNSAVDENNQDFWPDEWFFDELHLMNESEVRLISDGSGDTEVFDTTFNYTLINNKLSIDIDSDILEFDYVPGGEDMLFCIYSYTFSYFDQFSGQYEIGPLNVDFCYSEDPALLTENIASAEDLMLNDTIAINFSHVIMEKQ